MHIFGQTEKFSFFFTLFPPRNFLVECLTCSWVWSAHVATQCLSVREILPTLLALDLSTNRVWIIYLLDYGSTVVPFPLSSRLLEWSRLFITLKWLLISFIWMFFAFHPWWLMLIGWTFMHRSITFFAWCAAFKIVMLQYGIRSNLCGKWLWSLFLFGPFFPGRLLLNPNLLA